MIVIFLYTIKLYIYEYSYSTYYTYSMYVYTQTSVVFAQSSVHSVNILCKLHLIYKLFIQRSLNQVEIVQWNEIQDTQSALNLNTVGLG